MRAGALEGSRSSKLCISYLFNMRWFYCPVHPPVSVTFPIFMPTYPGPMPILASLSPQPSRQKKKFTPHASLSLLRWAVNKSTGLVDLPESSGSSGSSGKGLRDRSREESGTRARDSEAGYGPQNWTNKGIPNDLSDDYVEVRNKSRIQPLSFLSLLQILCHSFKDCPWFVLSFNNYTELLR